MDGLLNAGYRHITVLDITQQALQQSQARLEERARLVEWIAADVTAFQPDTTWELWHDRAVFHFLVTEEARAAYRRTLERALRPGGHAIIATFGPQGPQKCSGLPVIRYDPESLAAGPGIGLSAVPYGTGTTHYSSRPAAGISLLLAATGTWGIMENGNWQLDIGNCSSAGGGGGPPG